jgi:hypothetical protein
MGMRGFLMTVLPFDLGGGRAEDGEGAAGEAQEEARAGEGQEQARRLRQGAVLYILSTLCAVLLNSTQ